MKWINPPDGEMKRTDISANDYDLARQMREAKKVKCSEFGSAIIENL
jgi:isocitrate dehydrogenase